MVVVPPAVVHFSFEQNDHHLYNSSESMSLPVKLRIRNVVFIFFGYALLRFCFFFCIISSLFRFITPSPVALLFFPL